MFGTWKYDPETDEVQNLRRAYDPITARSSQHQACNRCHEKKLKCSGDKEGCDRCAKSGHTCVYNRPGSRSSRREKKTSGRNSSDGPAGGAREGSGSPSSHASSSQRLSSSKPRSRASSQRAHNPAPAAPPNQTRYESTIQADADYSMTSQHDTFAMGGLAGGYGSSSMSHVFPPQPQTLPSQDWVAGTQVMHAVTTAGLDQGYVSTAGPMYSTGDEYMTYDTLSDFEAYPNMDPRYWHQGPQ
ncbi:hypothetical protein CDD83_95 [Cordyceps sp. RAO-2017]|nr:hypothetical protein CDD83_95 [Cordyceps sp. RAO-2017]